MIASDWVNQHLATKIDGDGNLWLAPADSPDAQAVPVPVFLQIFGPAIDQALAAGTDVYAALCGAHTFQWEGDTLTMTADEMGYQGFFDQWHAEGII